METRLFQPLCKSGCPRCGQPVYILETTITQFKLNCDGLMDGFMDVLEHNCVGYCAHCNEPVYVIDTPDGFKIVDFSAEAVYLERAMRALSKNKNDYNYSTGGTPIILEGPQPPPR